MSFPRRAARPVALAAGALALLSASLATARSANCGAAMAASPAVLGGPVRVGVTPPPPLPAEVQPPIPAYGDVWTPGFWGWNPSVNDYFWIPGEWAAPPAIDLFWTPPWWQWDGAVFVFRTGYWGPSAGFYGGLNYGHGYFGHGYEGGYWNGRTIYYNRIYNNLGALRVNAVYERRAVDDRRGGAWMRPSYNGGRGGVVAAPTAAELAAARQARAAATAAQRRHLVTAAADRTLSAGVNGGRPRIPAVAGAPGLPGFDGRAARLPSARAALTRQSPRAGPTASHRAPPPAHHPTAGQHGDARLSRTSYPAHAGSWAQAHAAAHRETARPRSQTRPPTGAPARPSFGHPSSPRHSEPPSAHGNSSGDRPRP